jgi:glutamate synthase (NADPH/NADH) large chain
MSGGVAYVFDERGDFTEKRCNLDSVDLEPILEAQDESPKLAEAKLVKGLVARHLKLTGSPRAAWILDNWCGGAVPLHQSISLTSTSECWA